MSEIEFFVSNIRNKVYITDPAVASKLLRIWEKVTDIHCNLENSEAFSRMVIECKLPITEISTAIGYFANTTIRDEVRRFCQEEHVEA